MPSSLGHDVVRFLQAKLPEWLNFDPQTKRGARPAGKKSMRAASVELGLAPNFLSTFMKHGEPAGYDFAKAVTKAHYGREDITRLESEAREWAAANAETTFKLDEEIAQLLLVAERINAPYPAVRRVSNDLAGLKSHVTEEQMERLLRQAVLPEGDVVDGDIGGGLGDAKRELGRKM